MTETGEWVVQPAVDVATARAVLSQDRVANVYALSDLEPPYDAYTTVAAASREGSAEAACLVVRHPAFTGIVTHGQVEGVHALLTVIDLPQRTNLDIPEVHRQLIERFYDFTHPRERLLLAVAESTFRDSFELSLTPVRLGPADLDDVIDLYAGYEQSAFHAAQFEHGVFYGVRERGRLLASGGMPGLALQSGIGIVTSVFTRHEARRRGCGAAVTSAVTRGLFALGCQDVCLDVGREDVAALRLYERLGYQLHSMRWQGQATRREGSVR